MFLFASLALAVAPPALTAPQQQQLRCVALLAIVAGEQERRTAAALALPPLGRQGARFAQVTGDALIKETGRSQEQVRELILQQVAAIQKAAGAEAKLPIDEARQCVAIMNQVAPPPPPPSAVQCAGLMKLVADQSRRREGMSKATMDLVTLASVLENRARAELGSAGKSSAESDRELTLAREAIAAAPQTAPETDDCLELAKP
ncbi:hypothetical protein [Sphingomonas sp. ID1715]|uniref:hypothetical protein n=1 Tax=Sphingomonas sp. ID1715 TaxID=1656898 RepID=UPI0020C2B573|nr:hypothetical protein [Sphingomonas sp. ID1715]